jgi:hypothetical protein
LASRPTFTTQLYASGSTFFTVGFGDVSPMTPVAKLISVAEAGVGFGFIAVVIGYLPVLYQLYARREIHVMQLDARAGSPPCALTLLCRHAEGDARNDLANLLRSWEAWCSELLVSHLSYPMLSYYRSQRDNQSWLAGLAAIMDSCALHQGRAAVRGAHDLRDGAPYCPRDEPRLRDKAGNTPQSIIAHGF